MTFPPMVLLAFGEPVLLVIIYASLGALISVSVQFMLRYSKVKILRR